MTIKQLIEQAKAEGQAQFFVVYANIGDFIDELIVCSAEEADNAGAKVFDIQYIEHSNHIRTMIINAEVA